MSLSKILRKISDHLVPLSWLSYAAPYLYYFLLHLRDGEIHFLEWKKTQYFINYLDYGLIKRGLVGNFFVFIPTDFYKYLIVIVHTAIFAGLLKLFSHLTDLARHQESAKTSLIWLRVLFIFSPFFALQAGYDVGRYDLLNLLLLTASINFMQQGRSYLVSLLTVIALLNHEAYLFYGVPLITFLMIDKVLQEKSTQHISHTSKIALTLHVATAAMATMILYLYGNRKQQLDSAIGLGQQAWNRDLLEPSFGATQNQTILLIVVLCSIFMWIATLYMTNRGKPDLLILATLSPLVLFFLGVDYARWCGLLFFVVLMITFYKITSCGWQLNHWSMKALGLVFITPLGPIGIERLFPFWMQLLPLFKRLFA